MSVTSLFKKLIIFSLLLSMLITLSISQDATTNTETVNSQESNSEELIKTDSNTQNSSSNNSTESEETQKKINLEDLENLNDDQMKELLDKMKNVKSKEDAEKVFDKEKIEKSEKETVEELIKELGFDKKEKLNREDFKLFVTRLMSKDFKEAEQPGDEKEFIDFLVEKAVSSVAEEFSVDDLRDYILSDKLKKILEEAITEKFGFNFNDLLGSMGEEGEGEGENEEIDYDDEELANLSDLNEQANLHKHETSTDEKPEVVSEGKEDL